MRKEEQIGYQIKDTCRLLDKCIYYKSLLKTDADAKTATLGWVIGYLYHRRGEEVFQKDMEADFHMAKSSITSVLQNLEKSGYVKRVPVERDARLKQIVLTEAGERYHQSVKAAIIEMEGIVSQDLTELEKETLFMVIEKIKNHLEEEIQNDKERIG